MRSSPILAAAVLSLVAAPAEAQDAGRPSVRVEAEAEAASVRFDRQPRAGLRLHGCEGPATAEVEERRNLPARVAPGETYRDVRIRVTILAPLHLEAAAALREALAEVVPPACGDTEDETPLTEGTEGE
jgi:hypothetical protein